LRPHGRVRRMVVVLLALHVVRLDQSKGRKGGLVFYPSILEEILYLAVMDGVAGLALVGEYQGIRNITEIDAPRDFLVEQAIKSCWLRVIQVEMRLQNRSWHLDQTHRRAAVSEESIRPRRH